MGVHVPLAVAAADQPGAPVRRLCTAEAADAVSAAATARVCGSRVEILAGRSEYAQVFANPDGTSTFEATAVPARVRRPDGSWAAVDTTLHARTDGSLVPRAALADVVLSMGGSGPFVTYRDAGSTLTLSWPTALPRPSVDDDSAVYVDVLPGVDLRVTVTATGFQHVLVVKTRAAGRSEALRRIRYQIGGDVVGLALPDERVKFADKAGRTVAITSAASMWDSTVEPAGMGEVVAGVDLSTLRARPPAELISTADRPGAAAKSAPLVVDADTANGLVMEPDVGLLTDPRTTLPVFIDPQVAPVTTKWAYANSSNVNWAMDGKAWVGDNPQGPLFRSFFNFPTTSNGVTYKGKHVLAASFSIELTHSWSCTDTWAHLYGTGAVTVSNGARMSWSARPLGKGAKWLAAAAGHANEAGGCGYIQPNMIMTFGNNETMRAAVDAAAKANWNNYTVGICACNSQGQYESTQDRWKKFFINSKTTMSVTYNTVPGAPADLSPHQGEAACSGVVGTTSPVLRARYVDADGSDSLSATFNWRESPSGTVTSVAGTTEPANNHGTATLNLGGGAEGKSYEFQVRTFDAHDYSPWSAWCSFSVDTVAPLAPIVTPEPSGSAPVYAGCDPAEVSSCPANGGPGIGGAFTFSEPEGAAGDDVVEYVYGWDSPSLHVTVAPGATYGPVLLSPPRYGINTLAVSAVDGSGKQSPTTTFTFLVAGPSAPLAHWPLDTIDGHDLSDLIGDAHMVVSTSDDDVTWVPDTRLIGAAALRFDATPGESHGSTSAAGTGLDTSGSFSVSAWVRLATSECADTMDLVSMDGAVSSGFALRYNCPTGTWQMSVSDVDSTEATFTAAISTPVTVTGRWTHLVGVWDEAESKISLYVNGVLAASVTPPPGWLAARGMGWTAAGSLILGRSLTAGAYGGYVDGEIADVRVWNRAIVSDDIWGTDADPSTGVPAQVGLLSPLEVGSWRFRDGECYCTTTLDDSIFGRDVFLTPNWSIDPEWSGDPATTPAWLTADSHDGDGALRLDGMSSYASTTDDAGTLDSGDDLPHPVLRTDQSVTLTAWVRLAASTGSDQVVLRQGGGSASAVKLFVRGPDSKWAFAVSTPDGSAGYTWITASSDSAAQTDVWVHLVGQFDAAAGEVRIYVDGQLQTTSQAGGSGWHSSGSLVIGASSGADYFGGTVDQVRVWQGLLSPREIQNVYGTT